MKTDFNFEEVCLSRLEPGSEGVVTEIEDDGPVGRRLTDMGFLPHTLIKMVRRAPLGDPVEFELRGYRLCLRSSDADRVRVRVPR